MTLSRFVAPLVVAGSLAGAASLGGCYVSTQPEPIYATTEVTAAPVDIETRPHTTYEGRTVYLYNDHWYYRDGARWSYYQNEPAPLQRQRHYVQEAPPAQRGYEPPRGERNEPYYPNGPTAAPPAVRVQ